MTTINKLCFLCHWSFEEKCCQNSNESPLVLFLCQLFALPLTDRVKLSQVSNSDFCAHCERKLRAAMETMEELKSLERKLQNIRHDLQQLFLLTATVKSPEDFLESESAAISEVRTYIVQCLSYCQVRLLRLSADELRKYEGRAVNCVHVSKIQSDQTRNVDCDEVLPEQDWNADARNQDSSFSPASVIIIDDDPDFTEIEQVEPAERLQSKHHRKLRPRSTVAKAKKRSGSANSDSNPTSNDRKPDLEDSYVTKSQSPRSNSPASPISSDGSDSEDVEEVKLSSNTGSEAEEKPRRKRLCTDSQNITESSSKELGGISDRPKANVKRGFPKKRRPKGSGDHEKMVKPGKVRPKPKSCCVYCKLDFAANCRRPENPNDDNHLVDQHPYKCISEGCTSVFPSIKKLRIHHERKCPQDPKVNERAEKRKRLPYGNRTINYCVFCKLDLKGTCRRLNSEDNGEFSIEEFPYKCPEEGCNRVFPTVQKLRGHHEHKCPARPRSICPQCGKEFRTSDWLRVHIDTIHEKKFKLCCEHCGAGFQLPSALQKHIECVHVAERKFVCDMCGAGYKYPQALKCHMSKHTNKYPLMCEMCGKGFVSKSKLELHKEYTHGEEENYECKLCVKKFKAKGQLKYHLWYYHAKNRGPRQKKMSESELLEVAGAVAGAPEKPNVFQGSARDKPNLENAVSPGTSIEGHRGPGGP